MQRRPRKACSPASSPWHVTDIGGERRGFWSCEFVRVMVACGLEMSEILASDGQRFGLGGERFSCFGLRLGCRGFGCWMERVFDSQIGLIRGGTQATAPIHDGNCGANALRATIVGIWRGPSGESRFTPPLTLPLTLRLFAGCCPRAAGQGRSNDTHAEKQAVLDGWWCCRRGRNLHWYDVCEGLAY